MNSFVNFDLETISRKNTKGDDKMLRVNIKTHKLDM